MISDEVLDAWQTITNMATEPPWYALAPDGTGWNLWRVTRAGHDENSEADSKFAVCAREAMPELIAEVRRLREYGERWRSSAEKTGNLVVKLETSARVAAIETEERCIEEATAARENERQRCLGMVKKVESIFEALRQPGDFTPLALNVCSMIRDEIQRD